VNEHSGEMITLKMLVVTLIVISSIIHRALTNEVNNAIAKEANRPYFLSLIGGEDIFSEQLTKKIEEFISPTLQNSTKDLCRNHSEVYISGLRNGTAWAYQSK
jgi:hypothetical protein